MLFAVYYAEAFHAAVGIFAYYEVDVAADEVSLSYSYTVDGEVMLFHNFKQRGVVDVSTGCLVDVKLIFLGVFTGCCGQRNGAAICVVGYVDAVAVNAQYRTRAAPYQTFGAAYVEAAGYLGLRVTGGEVDGCTVNMLAETPSR